MPLCTEFQQISELALVRLWAGFLCIVAMSMPKTAIHTQCTQIVCVEASYHAQKNTSVVYLSTIRVRVFLLSGSCTISAKQIANYHYARIMFYEISDRGVSCLMSISFPLYPRRAIRVVRSIANLILVLTCLTTSQYLSFLFLAMHTVAKI